LNLRKGEVCGFFGCKKGRKSGARCLPACREAYEGLFDDAVDVCPLHCSQVGVALLTY
jgi:hypothetical protein